MSVCEYKEENCLLCKDVVLRKDLEYHNTEECRFRRTPCAFCQVMHDAQTMKVRLQLNHFVKNTSPFRHRHDGLKQGGRKHFTSLDREENGPHFLGNKIKHIMNYTPTLITASWYNSRFQCPLSFKFSGYRCPSRPRPNRNLKWGLL